ncbi:MAG: RES domain-containing protein [Steroidobacteraceae bacterium]
MYLYRIADRRYGPESGEGARLYGGRWNSPGRAVIYACTSLTGAMLEKLVHTGRQIPRHQVCVTFEAPARIAPTVLDEVAHPGWEAPDQIASRAAGDAWLAARRSAILLVPSVVFAIERNSLLNPAHPDAHDIRITSIEPVRWDERLFDLPRRQ